MAATLMNPGSQLLALTLATQRLHQLERDADAGEVLVGIVAVGALRIDHRERRRQRGIRFVMVRDDQIDAQFAGAPRRVSATDAAIDRNDQRHAFGMQSVDRCWLQPVAVLETLRDEVDHIGAEQFERAPQDDGGGDAVDVVVAVDRDPLAVGDRAHDPLDRDLHVGERHRIVQLIERRIEEARRQLRIADAALAQELRHDRGDVQRLGQPRSGGIVAGERRPAGANGGHQTFMLHTGVTERVNR